MTYNACDFLENAKIMNCRRKGLRLASNTELSNFAFAPSCGLRSSWILSIWKERVLLIHVAEDGLICSTDRLILKIRAMIANSALFRD